MQRQSNVGQICTVNMLRVYESVIDANGFRVGVIMIHSALDFWK